MKNKGIELAISFIGTVVRGTLLVLCAVFAMNVGKKAYDFGFRVFTEGPVAEAPGRDIIMSVAPEDGMTDISKTLEEKGITSDWMLFFIQAKLSEYKDKIEPGTYTLNNSMTTDEIMATLTKAELEKEDDDYAPVADELRSGELNTGDSVEAGSNLVDGNLEEGEVPYAGESGEIEIDDMGSDENESDGPEIEIKIGE